MNSPIESAIAALNSAYAADPAAVHALVCNRVPCNRALADHPTVQVEANRVVAGETFSVGALGLLNGVIEAMTGKRVAAKFSDEKDEHGAAKLVGFTEYQPMLTDDEIRSKATDANAQNPLRLPLTRNEAMPKAAISPDRAAQIVNNVAEEYADHGRTDFATAAELCETIRWLRDTHAAELLRKDDALDSIFTTAVKARLYKPC